MDVQTEGSSKQGKPANAGASPLAGVPLEGQLTPARERRSLRPPRGPNACATAQELYLTLQEIRLEAEALRDALAAKRP